VHAGEGVRGPGDIETVVWVVATGRMHAGSRQVGSRVGGIDAKGVNY